MQRLQSDTVRIAPSGRLKQISLRHDVVGICSSDVTPLHAVSCSGPDFLTLVPSVSAGLEFSVFPVQHDHPAPRFSFSML